MLKKEKSIQVGGAQWMARNFHNASPEVQREACKKYGKALNVVSGGRLCDFTEPEEPEGPIVPEEKALLPMYGQADNKYEEGK